MTTKYMAINKQVGIVVDNDREFVIDIRIQYTNEHQQVTVPMDQLAVLQEELHRLEDWLVTSKLEGQHGHLDVQVRTD